MSSIYNIWLQITDFNLVKFRQDHLFHHHPLQSQICTIKCIQKLTDASEEGTDHKS